MLQLEKNITITGNGDNEFPWQLIYLRYAHLVMKDGAALGPHTGNKPTSTAVYLMQDKKDRPWARFTMEGGSIANFTGPGSPIFSSGTKNTYPGIFIKTGGTLINNRNIVDSVAGNDGSKVNHMYFSTTALKSLGKDTTAVPGGTNASVEITGNGSYPVAQ
jgi:hypothetical protein